MNISGLPGSPHSVALHSITAVSITLSWLPGRSGGSAQTFTVYYRKDGEGKILYQDGIEAVEDNKLIVYKVPGLDPETKYYFKVQAKNSWGERISLLEIPGLTLGWSKWLFTYFLQNIQIARKKTKKQCFKNHFHAIKRLIMPNVCTILIAIPFCPDQYVVKAKNSKQNIISPNFEFF